MIRAWLQKTLPPFGGVQLEGHKELSNQQATRVLCPQSGDELVIPLQQHTGQKPEVQVKTGDYVLKGQIIARAEGTVSVPIHATTSGTICTIEKRPIPHPSGLDDTCIILSADGKDNVGDAKLTPLEDYSQYNAESLRQRIREAGIVGMGGAVFPSAIKLRVHQHIAVDTLVINGAECEPYITCDDVLMREQAEEILAGAQIMLHVLSAEQDQATPLKCLIGIEDNKVRAIEVMQAATEQLDDSRIRVITVPTQYPAGGEKQLIHTLTHREVPSRGRPADIGVICHNVATSRAIYRAVVLGEPLISRYVTVTGEGINTPCNLEVPLGLPLSTLISAAGGYRDTSAQLVMGGPMMGISLRSDRIPVVKATNCILVNSSAPKTETPLPCIRCSRCADHCPAGLLPQQLYWYSKARDFNKVEDYQLFDCIECGCCSYVCPSHIPLVDYYRFAKAQIREARQASDKAELARERHDFHNFRLERARKERAERLAKHKKKAVAGDKKDAIQAALARAKAKKARLAQEKQQAEQANKQPDQSAPANKEQES